MPEAPTDPESNEAFKARTCAALRRLTDLALALAENAALQALSEPAEPEPALEKSAPKPPRPRDHHADFARAAAAARHFIALEHRLRAQRAKSDADPKSPPKQDRRRQLVQGPLYAHIKAESGTVKTQLKKHIDQTIETHLETMPDSAALEIYQQVCRALDIHPDPKHLSDEIIGLEPPKRPGPEPPGGHRLW